MVILSRKFIGSNDDQQNVGQSVRKPHGYNGEQALFLRDGAISTAEMTLNSNAPAATVTPTPTAPKFK